MSRSKNQRVLRRDPEVDWDDAVKFRLTYEGRLLGASRGNTRSAHKHEIRRALHPQLKTLWAATRHLSDPTHEPIPRTKFYINSKPMFSVSPARLDQLSNRFALNSYNFVPLITEDLSLHCGLDILFLRPGSPGTLMASGDIDNRLKTLFDALRMPKVGELPQSASPPEGERPFFCLLEDDKLVSELSVETDALLESVSDQPDENDARLIITVKIRPYELTIANLGFA